MVGVTMVVLAISALIAGGVIAALRRLPIWGHTWTGAAVMIVVRLIGAGDDKPYLFSPMADVIILITLILMLGAALGASSWRGPLLGGLASLSTTMILSLVTVWLVHLGPFNRLDLALLAAPLGLLHGVLLYSFVTGPPARRVGLLVVGGLLCLAAMVSPEYLVSRQWQLDHNQPMEIWTLLAIRATLLASGPAAGLVFQWLRSWTVWSRQRWQR